MIPLLMTASGDEVEIKMIKGDATLKSHIQNMGMAVGSKVKVVSSDDGDIILEVKDVRIALTKSMASKIFI